ncbi:hypothetical protein INS49_007897 [Diaporthe citri]|uniref:uncharacterized protein n=1 Tax=Diaporthe citri TaxID=83186 RepID=UPI001C8013BE|nr:uncharacterized protein INS49_007897 [Diaporthe citri]KAG6362803.1 hypothetical protein INS49_007897 [Diaporthe citri]
MISKTKNPVVDPAFIKMTNLIIETYERHSVFKDSSIMLRACIRLCFTLWLLVPQVWRQTRPWFSMWILTEP